jgi:hypothetical protein
VINDLDSEISDAVQWYWATLSNQEDAQRESENSTRGRRAQVLGGDQMSGFEGLVEDVLVENGLPRESVVHDHAATLPGYYRPTKRWDIAVVHDDQLLAAIEFKSIASSFGNNLNNRAEEAVGSNTDLYQAYEEGVFEPSPAPWVGYLILMADNEDSNNVPRLHEPNFPADDEFQDATYIDRVEQLCLRMVRQRITDGSAFLLTDKEGGLEGEYSQPNEELQFERFIRSLLSHVMAHVDHEQDTLNG